MAGRLWKSVAAFCLGNSLSHGSVGALSDFLSPWQARSWPWARLAVLLQSQAKPRSLHLVKHSLLLTLVTQQTVYPLVRTGTFLQGSSMATSTKRVFFTCVLINKRIESWILSIPGESESCLYF